jgi:glycosyltransferase involved in cell wall biosynthesis
MVLQDIQIDGGKGMDSGHCMPRILIVTSGILPVPAVWGGAVERLVTDILDENEKRKKAEITVVTIANERIRPERYECSKIIQVMYPKVLCFFDLMIDKLLRSLHAKNTVRLFDKRLANAADPSEYDLIVIENLTHLARVIQKRAKKTGSKAKMFFHIHNQIDMYRSPAVIRKLTDSGVEFLTVSGYLKNEILKVSPDSRATVLYNGTDLRLLDPGLRERQKELREQFGIPSNARVVLYAGRIIPEKGILELVEAFFEHLCSTSGSNLCLVIAGGGVRLVGGRTKYERKVNSELLLLRGHEVRLGRLSYEQVPKVYAAADVLAVPTVVDEAFGMSVLEGMAMGLPVITTATGGVPEVLGGKDGYLEVSRDDLVRDLTEVLNRINSKEYGPVLEEMGKRNREEVLKREGFDRSDYYDRFLTAVCNAPEVNNGHE